jgi:hypothetical protein
MGDENSNLSIGAAVDGLAASGRLTELSQEELERLAEDLGLDATRFQEPGRLAAALDERRQLIAGFDRRVMAELLRWGRRTVPSNAPNEEMAREIVLIRSMRFSGLGQGELLILAQLRGAEVSGSDDIPTLIQKLKRQEGLYEKWQRKKRAMIGKFVSNLVGGNVPRTAARSRPSDSARDSAAPHDNIKEEIEESGLWSGITNRIKRTADQYLDQKLDEIELRIDRKLQEIDDRLSEWRDKEIANRLKILKITLWASVIVALVSLLYSWMRAIFLF